MKRPRTSWRRRWTSVIMCGVVVLALLPSQAGHGLGATAPPAARPTAAPATPPRRPRHSVHKPARPVHDPAARSGHRSVTARRHDPAGGYRLRIALAGAARRGRGARVGGRAARARVLTPRALPRRTDQAFFDPYSIENPLAGIYAPDGLPVPLDNPRALSTMHGTQARRIVPADAAHTVVVNTDLGTSSGAGAGGVAALQAHPFLCLANDGSTLVPCISLLDAIDAINHSGPGYTIVFAFDPRVTYSKKRIALVSPLEVTQPNTTIDGDDGSGKPGVTIKSPGKDITTFLITSDGNTLTHVATDNVTLSGASAHDNHVAGNYIGVDPAGKPLPLNGNGVEIVDGAHDNVIGGLRSASTCADPCNVIGGNDGAAILISDTTTMNNVVQGNNIGVDATGAISIANRAGVQIVNAPGTTVGGDKGAETGCAGPCNIIDASLGDGVLIVGSASSATRVEGNYIGVDATGAVSVPNTLNGIDVGDGVAGAGIGGDKASAAGCAGPCNLISGNSGSGVLIIGATATDNLIQGNYIGVDATGAISVPNAGAGIVLQSAQRITVGGDRGAVTTCAGPCNLISGNGQDGVRLLASSLITVTGNYIGVDATGTKGVSNGGPDRASGWAGVALYSDFVSSDGAQVAGTATGNTIGGDRGASSACAGACNVIGGSSTGVGLADSGATGNTVAGNNIGVGATGAISVPNGQAGVGVVQGASRNTIGGFRAAGDSACDHTCNAIGGNTLFGVVVQGAGTNDNTVAGNDIGSNSAGTGPLPNGYGVLVNLGAQGNSIGGAGTPAKPGPAPAPAAAYGAAGAVPTPTALPGDATATALQLPRPPAARARPLTAPVGEHAGGAAAAQLQTARDSLPTWQEIDRTLGITSPAPAGADPDGGPGESEDIRAREQWFYQQRAYPGTTIPGGALSHALAQRASLVRTHGVVRAGRSDAAAAATWQEVGNRSQQGGDWGPAGGRVTSLAMDPTDSTGKTLYAGTAAGGVWKTTDGGATWTPMADEDKQPSLAIGALAIDPTNPSKIYAATGEANSGGDNYYGAGLLRSANGGSSWTSASFAPAGSTGTFSPTVSRLVVDPANPSVLYAALGLDPRGAAKANQGGIYRSIDSGVSWTQVLGPAAMTSGTPIALGSCGSPPHPPMPPHIWMGLTSPWPARAVRRPCTRPCPSQAASQMASGRAPTARHGRASRVSIRQREQPLRLGLAASCSPRRPTIRGSSTPPRRMPSSITPRPCTACTKAPMVGPPGSSYPTRPTTGQASIGTTSMWQSIRPMSPRSTWVGWTCSATPQAPLAPGRI